MKTIDLSDEDYRLIEETLRMDSESHTMSVELRDRIGAARLRMTRSARDVGENAGVRPRWLSEREAHVLDTPPMGWNNLATDLKNMEGHALGEVASGMNSLVCHISRATGYFNGRDLGMDHKDSVKKSNRVVTSVRKALGYAYPDQGKLSF